MILLGLAMGLLITPPQTKPDLADALEWRCIGPFRAGRTVGACGIADQPFVFYIGVNNGGVWKTNDAGRTWKPIFDDQPTGSIGDVMVAPSNPNVVYVGTGEGLQRPDLATGNGMYKSDNAGQSWTYLGLPDVQQIGNLDIDPTNENRVFVAGMGHPYGANEERGIYRTTDGGRSWKKVLYIDDKTCGMQVTVDPTNPQVVYADMWQAQQGPWENAAWQGPGSGLYKSTDGGDTWKKLTNGLPTFEQGLGRIGFAVSMSNSKVLYATVDSGELGGLYRSNDAGESWTRVNSERRLISRGTDFAEVKVDPKDSEKVYVGDTSFYRSTDGGKTFICIKGSPGGDDYHRTWINPKNPDIILSAADQGAAVSLNGGETWSSWYNQPTAQLYHVATDNAFPYNVYGGQQESGSVMISSRGNDGQITFREWHAAGGDEYCYSAPDPLNPRYVYGGRINRYDKVTGETVNIRPPGQFRVLRTAPVIFSKADPRALYFAGNVLFKTLDGGKNWETISPDLSRETWAIPASVGAYSAQVTRRGVIYTVAPSPKDPNVIWCGTDDGLLWVTTDGGKNWKDVTGNALTPWSKVSLMDAGHFDTKTAYAAINRIRLDDQRPHILRTHDNGATWTEIVKGLPDSPVNVVREDHVRPGLLFCGTETGVHYSTDDGDNWQPLRLNMPATSIRDLVIHGDDLVIGTHGRGIWILDNFSLLRHRAASPAGAQLYPVASAYLLERNENNDTPLPQDEPVGKNPPHGAMIDYELDRDASLLQLDIVDSTGQVVRTLKSSDLIPPVDPKAITVMPGWAKVVQPPTAKKGLHRFVWDMTLPPAAGARGGLPISAVWGETPYLPLGPAAKPGVYTVRLTVDGAKLEQKLELKVDPRK